MDRGMENFMFRFLALALFSLPMVAHAQDPPSGDLPSFLAGRPEIEVQTLATREATQVMDHKAIRRQTELVLSRNNVPVSQNCKQSPANNCGTLVVHVDGVSILNDKVYAFYLWVEYKEWATPTRKKSRDEFFSTLWQTHEHILLGSNQLHRLGDYLERLVERFALDYLRANQKAP